MSRKKRKGKKVLPEFITTAQNCATDFKLTIPDDVYQKIAYWLRKTANEVSGFGSLEWNAEAKAFTVKDVILLKQEVGRASTEICPAALGKAMFQMKDEPLGLKWHWHTHPNMGVFWSGDDMEIIRSLGQQGWIIATVFNEKGEHKSAFYTKTQVLGQDHDVFKNDLPTEVVRFLPRAFFQALDEEYDKCVTTTKYPAISGISYYGGNGKLYNSSGGEWVGPGTHTKVGGDDEIPAHKEPGFKREYSSTGYTQIAGDWIYNPIHDDMCPTEQAQLNAIAEMADDEVRLLRNCEPAFDELYRKYILRDVEMAGMEGYGI